MAASLEATSWLIVRQDRRSFHASEGTRCDHDLAIRSSSERASSRSRLFSNSHSASIGESINCWRRSAARLAFAVLNRKLGRVDQRHAVRRSNRQRPVEKLATAFSVTAQNPWRFVIEPPQHAQRSRVVITLVDLDRALKLEPRPAKRSHASDSAVGLRKQREIHADPEMTLDSVVIQRDCALARANPRGVELLCWNRVSLLPGRERRARAQAATALRSGQIRRARLRAPSPTLGPRRAPRVCDTVRRRGRLLREDHRVGIGSEKRLERG